jgi:hypothetical protein
MILRMLTLAGAATLLTSGAFAAPLDDSDYCQELSSLYRVYARSNQINVAAVNAMHDCDSGKASSAVPVLQKILTDNKVPVPPR